MEENKEPRFKKVIDAADGLSLGISMVVAVLFGVGIGWLMREWTGIGWLFWLGVFWGIAAALLNIYKAYKKQKKELDKLANDPRYNYKATRDRYDDEDEDEKY
ncbi:MAG TPA: AtpZ/AtpI family protein [Epsilonproteobacteria bacterium]|nr:AtpZ/AtpI family protein [Campylobacterota bacterium]